MPNTYGVVIKVYVESNSRNIRHLSESNPASKRAKRSHGYDRRSLLLAYSQELRRADHNHGQIRWNEKIRSSRHKSKKWRCATTPTRIGISLLGIFRKARRRWKYQRMASEKDNNNSSNGKKKKLIDGRRKFWRKLKRMLKGLSSVWQRKKKVMESR